MSGRDAYKLSSTKYAKFVYNVVIKNENMTKRCLLKIKIRQKDNTNSEEILQTNKFDFALTKIQGPKGSI